MYFVFIVVWLHLLYSYVVFLFVFFFFKQKTAYEMRISDWSSDVCSSDLRLEAKHFDLELSRRFCRLDLVLLAVLKLVQGIEDFLEAWQIGRASCRERVCQYV